MIEYPVIAYSGCSALLISDNNVTLNETEAMDVLTNFSLKYTEHDDETLTCDTYRDNVIDYGKYYGEITPENCTSSEIVTSMMFSRQSSLDSISTTGWDGYYSVESDYSQYISSCTSPSDIPDSPSESIPQKSGPTVKDNGLSEDEDDKDLLENCLQLGIHAMLPAHNNEHRRLGRRRDCFIASKNECNELIDNEINLLEECWWNGINAMKIRCDAENACEDK